MCIWKEEITQVLERIKVTQHNVSFLLNELVGKSVTEYHVLNSFELIRKEAAGGKLTVVRLLP